MKNTLTLHGDLKKYTKADGNRDRIGWSVTWQRDKTKFSEVANFEVTVNGDTPDNHRTVISAKLKSDALDFIKKVKSNPAKVDAINLELTNKIRAKNDRNETKLAKGDTTESLFADMGYDTLVIGSKVEVVKVESELSFEEIMAQQIK